MRRNAPSASDRPDQLDAVTLERFLAALPRAKSGSVVRRILRKVAAGDLANLGDPGALVDPAVLDELLKSPARA